MKTGKYFPMGVHENVKIGYGTVDYVNLKTIYLKLNSWVEPVDDDEDFDNLIKKSRKYIKDYIYNLNLSYLHPQSIVDLNIKSNGIKIDKSSFMNLEVTLYVKTQVDVKSRNVRQDMKNILENIIDIGLSNKNLYNFSKTKKIS